MENRKCRLCEGKLFSAPIIELKGMPKAAQFYPTENEFITDKGIDLNVYQCSECSLVQIDIEPVDYFREVITAATFSEKTLAFRLMQINEFVEKFGLKGKKALDVGTAKGDMLDIMTKAGLESYGIEASKKSVELGRAAKRKMIHGYIGDIEQIDGGPFDAFISLNYLEHLPEPGNIIKRIHKNTTEDAVGFVTVPNLEYLLKSKCFYEFVADHLSYFTKNTLTHAFESNGFEVLESQIINEENDVAVTIRKKKAIELSGQFSEVTELINNLKTLVTKYKNNNKKIAVWGAGHRTLALLALSNLNDIAFVVDSAPFKQGKYTPVLHLDIVSPSRLKEDDIDLILVMVPGLYPDEVYKTLLQMKLSADIALVRGNHIEYK
jgi:2-polyprenyl-3-methyl-5-hydroxy-6-metoxy-1,4-benzoquinol methylase